MDRDRITHLLSTLSGSISPEAEAQVLALLASLAPAGASAVARGPGAPALPDRYEDRGLLGAGGMGEVRRVWDRVLCREVAMKLVRPEVALAAGGAARFVEEARATAALAHPGIVSVYDHGFAPDGRPWFTMQIVRGDTLQDLIGRAHADSGDLRLAFRRLVDVVQRACDAVGYAHARGVVHLDLKPANLLVGEHGEVRVVDWGLFRGAQVVEAHAAGVAPGSAGQTRVSGTPAYMAPEQARGDRARIDTRADVYALGCVLWEMVAGHPPARGPVPEILEGLRAGRVPPAPKARFAVAEALMALIERCTAPEPEARPADAREVGAALRRWLDGEDRRDRARSSRVRAAALAGGIEVLRDGARAAREHADRLLAANAAWEPDTTREAWWAADDVAADFERELRATERAIDEALESALAHDPDDEEAHAAAAARARSTHAAAEAAGDFDAAAVAETRLRRHVAALPEVHPERVRAVSWLRGDGALTLHSDPPGAEAVLHRYDVVRRRLVPVPERSLGRTPLEAVSIPHGRWLVTLEVPGRPVVRYPIRIDRQEHWHGVPPDGTTPTPIAVPTAEALGPDDVYVPAGWTHVGGDPEAPTGLPALRVWVDAFVMRRFVVTNAEYLRFVNERVAAGDRTGADRYAPHTRGTTPGARGEVLFAWDGSRYALPIDSEGDRWEADWPIIMVDHVAAWTFARWEASRTGQPWRLPGELEWEKAARGPDRRIFPWGDHVDPAWSTNRLAFRGAPGLEPVDSRPPDTSVYGVRGMAGGVMEWTADRMTLGGATADGQRVIVPDGSAEGEEAWAARDYMIVGRGASLVHKLNAMRSAFRLACDPWSYAANVGFRLARPL